MFTYAVTVSQAVLAAYGMLAAYKNQALEVCKQENNIMEAEWFRALVLLQLFEVFVSFVSVACL